MPIQTLFLKNFRSYEKQLFIFGPQVNVICGPNAKGKTTVLEAIHLFMNGRSFRTSRLSDLIRHGAPGFYIEVNFIRHGVEQSLRMSYDGKERKIFYNDTPCQSITSLIGILSGSIMLPEDIAMVKGPPSLRRRYLDIQLAQSDPLYVHHLLRYHRALSQRNNLLRRKSFETMEVWEHELAKGGEYIARQRQEAVEELASSCKNLFSGFADGAESISLSYKTQCSRDKNDRIGAYKELYKRMRGREARMGNTLVGPHKDDLDITIDEKAARLFASDGQQRSCVAALRLAEWKRLRRYAEESPSMLVDDISVSLDRVRRENLMRQIGSLNQVFITTTENAAPVEEGVPINWIYL